MGTPGCTTRVKRFHDRQRLNFRLLADEDHAVADAYGVSPRGKVAHVIPKVSPKTHDGLKILGDL